MQQLGGMKPVHSILTKLVDYRWKILRSQHLDTQVGKKQECSDQQREITSAKDWCEEADDWGLNEEAEAQGDMSQHLLTTSASKVSTSTAEAECTDNFHNLSLSEPGQGLVLPLSYIVLPSHHISVMDEEDYTGCIDVHHAQKLLKEYQQREGVDVEQLLSESFSAKGEQEKYEKSEMKTRDLLFHQFKKRISVCQEQILRYSWKGQPLFITSPPSTFPDVVPRCCVCGSDRDFEFQLMPALISILTHLDNSLSLEFGTVLVYTCEKSCWPSGQSSPLEEFPFIQEDPDERYFR
ncbi:programmed cell death protein 2-like isoform X3 [Pleurodeles waltl]|uniref:programmed cell death protein 2-like isoform X3 n=1 Tax=Pleurodeles waltl TaxID=8319 RepID=UPI003709799B